MSRGHGVGLNTLDDVIACCGSKYLQSTLQVLAAGFIHSGFFFPRSALFERRVIASLSALSPR